MGMLKNLSKVFASIFPFIDFVYIAQLDEYLVDRYFLHANRFFFRRGIQRREKLIFTSRAKFHLFLSAVFYVSLIIVLIVYSFQNPILGLGLIFFVTISIPYLVGIVNIFLAILYKGLRDRIYTKAVLLLSRLPKEKHIIAIAGSYGKTTTKYFLYELLKTSYKVQIIPENINTPIGVALYIINHLDESADILIVEVDAYSKHEMIHSAHILHPSISVITNIGDQHLERFGNEKNLADALLEIFRKAREGAHLITDKETAVKMQGMFDQKILIADTNSTLHYLNKRLAFPAQLPNSAFKSLSYALLVSELFKVPYKYVSHTVKNLLVPDRRRRYSEDVLGLEGLDDSYNISYSSALSGVQYALQQAKERKKKLLVVTAGIPELGKQFKDNNSKYGCFLDKNACFTIVLNSIFAKDIEKGFSNKDNYSIINNLSSAAMFIRRSFKREEWFVLFQPELNDLYYLD